VAGVNSTSQPPRIAISDPDEDNAETGGPGRVLPQGVTHAHNATPPHMLHNNASYVSHDIYNVTFTANIMPPPLPHVTNASWALANYPAPPGTVAVVEWAVVVSPLPVEEEVCGVNITSVVPWFKGEVVNEAFPTWEFFKVNATVQNNGTITTNCTVTAYYNESSWHQIGNQTVTNLAPGNSETVTFTWNLSGLASCNNYTLKVNASCVCGGSDEFVYGNVWMRVIGDVNGIGGASVADMVEVDIALGAGPGDPNWNLYADVDGNCQASVADMVQIDIHLGEEC